MTTSNYRSLLWGLLFGMVVLLALLPVAAQVDEDNRPIPITPANLLPGYDITPTFDPNFCYDPLPIAVGDTIYIKSGVNIRAAPSGSAALVWNTVYNNRDDDGQIVDNPVAIEAIVDDGPVCNFGMNYWQVDIFGNDGWVAEGRPDRPGGYLLIIPGFDFTVGCSPRYDLEVGETVNLARNVRVRLAPDTDARTLTIVPFGTDVTLVQGPECVNDYEWWLVRATVAGQAYSGWMAEGANGIYWMIPYDLPSIANGNLCIPALPFNPGERGYVFSVQNDDPRWLHESPGINAPRRVLLPENTPFRFLEGPLCVDNINWWGIEVATSDEVGQLRGWIAEGSGGRGGYFITNIDPDEYAR